LDFYLCKDDKRRQIVTSKSPPLHPKIKHLLTLILEQREINFKSFSQISTHFKAVTIQPKIFIKTPSYLFSRRMLFAAMPINTMILIALIDINNILIGFDV
jgi:hypothetical protein